MEPTMEKVAQLAQPSAWILQKKVNYAAFVPTPEGPKSKAELRMMFLWPENGEPVLATVAHLDSLGAAADDRVAFAEAMKRATGTVDELVRDVERGYKLHLR